MFDPIERQQAAAMGWELREVYDLKTSRMELAVLPLDFEKHNAVGVYNGVVHLAKQRHALAIKALTLIAQYNMPKGKPCPSSPSSRKTRSSKK